ncbi:hypothetical protein B0H10DRAFT_1958170 [Mycena sp. CBHHK59/15]|nr:hypothetical protein B0H10DRAFT_1958170 [Mycena sp. CBHHK59/15]
MAEPPQLLLLALTWAGWPTTVSEGNEETLIGTYCQVAAISLNRVERNAAVEAVEYVPACAAKPWFLNILGRSVWYAPDRLGRNSVSIEEPDLPGQDEEGPGYDEGHEPDSQQGLGWQGDWVNALLERQEHYQNLGERTKTIWNNTSEPMWGIEVRLEARRVVETDYEKYGEEDSDNAERNSTQAISDNDIHVTILRVFVKDEEIQRLLGPEEEEEEYEDSMDEGKDGKE